MLLRGRIRYVSRTIDGIKLKLLLCVEGDVEETKGTICMLLQILQQLFLLLQEDYLTLFFSFWLNDALYFSLKTGFVDFFLLIPQK